MNLTFVIVGVLGVLLVLVSRFRDPAGYKKTLAIVGAVCALISMVGSAYARANSERNKNEQIAALAIGEATQRRISAGRSSGGGEGGIRTLGTFWAHTLSKRAP